MKSNPRTVELVKSSYKPAKAELNEKNVLDIPGVTVMQRVGSLGSAVLWPIKPRRITKPRNRHEACKCDNPDSGTLPLGFFA